MPFKMDDETTAAPDSTGAVSYHAGDAPALYLTLWPHRSPPRRGFAAFILITFALLLIPLFAVIGTLVLWGLLPFLLGTLALTWILLERSYKDGELTEVLRLWSDRIDLVRLDPRRPPQDWHANPHWVQVKLRPSGGPVENYVTLKGGGREVEIGAFLSPDERRALHHELTAALARINAAAKP